MVCHEYATFLSLPGVAFVHHVCNFQNLHSIHRTLVSQISRNNCIQPCTQVVVVVFSVVILHVY
jgi:hypothetical protein